MSSTAPLKLKTAIEDLAHHRALKDGTVTIPGVELEHIEMPADHASIFKRMCRDLEFDVCELSIMSYYTAREYGLPMRAIPVAPVHLFWHGAFLKNVNAGIESPKDLEGKKVGTRTYTVTPGVLQRGILTDEFGVDVHSITWVLAEPEHVAEVEAHYPPNVIPGTDEDLFPRLAAGDLDAGIAGSNLHGSQSPNVVPLFSNARELDRAQYERTGIVPVFTVIVIKEDVLEPNAWLAEALFEGFKRSREHGLDASRVAAIVTDGDPAPIGRAANYASFEEILRLGREQKILTKPMTVEDLFPDLE
jgi:4,5-dihydroxyphthalate decarboxylase